MNMVVTAVPFLSTSEMFLGEGAVSYSIISRGKDIRSHFWSVSRIFVLGVAGVCRSRYSERPVLYRVLFHYFDRFLTMDEHLFKKEHGVLRPIIKDVVERDLDCGTPHCGFARIRCPDCGEQRLLMFSCRACGFCPSFLAMRLEEWSGCMRRELLLDVPHRRVIFTIPGMLRFFFRYNRPLLDSLHRLALLSLARYFEAVTGSELMPGFIAAVQTVGTRINLTRISISW